MPRDVYTTIPAGSTAGRGVVPRHAFQPGPLHLPPGLKAKEDVVVGDHGNQGERTRSRKGRQRQAISTVQTTPHQAVMRVEVVKGSAARGGNLESLEPKWPQGHRYINMWFVLLLLLSFLFYHAVRGMSSLLPHTHTHRTYTTHDISAITDVTHMHNRSTSSLLSVLRSICT